jgi:hypothetical protein
MSASSKAKAEGYRNQAAKALDQAQKSGNTSARGQMVRIAELYLKLADAFDPPPPPKG